MGRGLLVAPRDRYAGLPGTHIGHLADAVAEVAQRPGAPAEIVVAAPVGTDPELYRDVGATWVVITGWLDELRELASRPPPPTSAG